MMGGLGFVVLGVLCFVVLADAVSVEKLSRISVGMTRVEVETIIGAPEHIRQGSGGSSTYYYGGLQRLRWCSVEIPFGADGRVAGSVFHDH